jgi:hypothetical protein
MVTWTEEESTLKFKTKVVLETKEETTTKQSGMPSVVAI